MFVYFNHLFYGHHHNKKLSYKYMYFHKYKSNIHYNTNSLRFIMFHKYFKCINCEGADTLSFPKGYLFVFKILCLLKNHKSFAFLFQFLSLLIKTYTEVGHKTIGEKGFYQKTFTVAINMN